MKTMSQWCRGMVLPLGWKHCSPLMAVTRAGLAAAVVRGRLERLVPSSSSGSSCSMTDMS